MDGVTVTALVAAAVEPRPGIGVAPHGRAVLMRVRPDAVEHACRNANVGQHQGAAQ